MVTQEKHSQSSSASLITLDDTQAATTSIVTLDETQAATTSEINSSVTKKPKLDEYESLSNVEVQALSKSDIGLYLNKDHIPTTEMFAVLTDPWIPSSRYKFPQINMNQKMRSVCQRSWLFTYPCLSYSQTLQGVLRRYCVLFQRKWSASDRAKNSLGQLVLKPLTSLHKAHDYIQSHEKTDYHLFSKEQAERFIMNYSDPNKAIDHILDNENQQQEANNRKTLPSIIKCIIFIGKQNLAFRGHDEDGIAHKSTNGLGSIILQANDCTFNFTILLGNFKELILFRVESGDTVLDHHLKTCTKNAMYMSADIQNELIGICADMIKAQILSSIIEEKKFYSVIADATLDISGTEQMSLSIRYLCHNNDQIVIKEDFIGFTPITDNSAIGIPEHIITCLRSVGLDLAYLRGRFFTQLSFMILKCVEHMFRSRL